MNAWYHTDHSHANLFLCGFMLCCAMMGRITSNLDPRQPPENSMTETFQPNGILSFLTDFSSSDGYVGAMKGVALCQSSDLTIVDIGHDIPPFDIRRAAYTLRMAVPEFPNGTTHVAVVDPGVGTSRNVLVAHMHNQLIVAPDNGLISLLLDWAPDARVFAVESTHLTDDVRSATFHGRDVFAPIAARIAAGSLPIPGELRPHSEPIVFDTSFRHDNKTISGSILCADRFGNLITSIPFEEILVAGLSTVELGQIQINRFVETYGNAEPGTLVALKGSLGLLEISVVNGNAGERIGVTNGATVLVRS